MNTTTNNTAPTIKCDDGENPAVRAFLLCYGAQMHDMTIGRMREHLTRSGLPYWPEWAAPSAGSDGMHLTKMGAQSWLRYLFSLEEAPSVGPLSSRLRPDVECAPWVIPDVKKLEHQAATLRSLLAEAKLDEDLYEKQLVKLCEILRHARCPHVACKDGQLPPDGSECQWCSERAAALNG